MYLYSNHKCVTDLTFAPSKIKCRNESIISKAPQLICIYSAWKRLFDSKFNAIWATTSYTSEPDGDYATDYYRHLNLLRSVEILSQAQSQSGENRPPVRLGAVGQRFGDVNPAHFFFAVEVRQGAGHLQHPMEATCREPHGIGRLSDQRKAVRVRLGDLVEQRRRAGLGTA